LSLFSAFVMDSRLTRHLKAKGVHQDIINHLGDSTVGCFTMDIFAAFVDDRGQIQAAILDKVSAHKESVAQLACLKTAWREAEAWQSRRITRQAEGLPEETLEEPLSPEVSKDVINTFKTKYSWPNLDPRRMPSDSLFGRIHREFERRQPSMYPVSRVRTLAFVQHRAPAKKTKITDRIHLELDGDSDGEETNAQPMADWANKLEVLCLGWAISGTFSIEWKNEQTVYAAWHEVSKYHYEFRRRGLLLCRRFSEVSVHDYISSVEEDCRVLALDMARDDPPKPWGKALVDSLGADAWQERKDLLRGSRGSGGGGGGDNNPGKQQPGGGGGKPQGGGPPSGAASSTAVLRSASDVAKNSSVSKKRWQTVSTIADGTSVCKPYNDKRGCYSRCPKGEAHCCDIRLASGKPCANRGHTRLQHDEVKHGKPAIQ